ncbi:hypothetical protein D0864_15671 [Hortaea werneckii]|uniref:Uncharacterized protein n=1 Tax=Hortaea werneckii TaxID=91943 RepID=A0A3M7BWQ7_HORWE|nr:hypothetical protein D0864_15671 [Hortaea werneckii]RMZ05322.1 hypothetical protein D0862_05026 [Hortaea werneckii]
MSAWKGWNELEVRGNKGMAGFTPVNAPAAANNEQSGLRATGSPSRSISAAAGPFERVKTGQTSPAATQTPCHPTTKKASGKGRKRGSTAKSGPKSKRRKSNTKRDITSSSPSESQITDAWPALKTSGTVVKKGTGSVSLTSSHVSEPTINSMVSVYAQPTSMDAVHSTGQPTSMSALKSQQLTSRTAHGNLDSSATKNNGIKQSQPLLDRPDGNGALRQSQHLPSTVDQQSTLSYSEEEDEFGPPLELEPEHPSTNGGIVQRQETIIQVPISHSRMALNSVRKRTHQQNSTPSVTPNLFTEEEAIALDDSDEDLLADVTNEAEKAFVRGERTSKQNVKEVDEHDDYGGALLTDAEKQLLSSFRATNRNDEAKPVVRTPFPSAVRDRSPIWGASNTTVLRTCFRIGEALNVGCQAVRSDRPVLLELYARVVDSWHEGAGRGEGRKQNFVLHDLYHDKPPYVDASFSLCGQSKVWDADTTTFLTRRDGGIMCRAVGQMKKERCGRGKWYIHLLSIWEATWEDVHAVAGIYAKDMFGHASDDDGQG